MTKGDNIKIFRREEGKTGGKLAAESGEKLPKPSGESWYLRRRQPKRGYGNYRPPLPSSWRRAKAATSSRLLQTGSGWRWQPGWQYQHRQPAAANRQQAKPAGWKQRQADQQNTGVTSASRAWLNRKLAWRRLASLTMAAWRRLTMQTTAGAVAYTKKRIFYVRKYGNMKITNNVEEEEYVINEKLILIITMCSINNEKTANMKQWKWLWRYVF